MRILQTTALIALACIAAAQDTEKLNLTRQFKEGSVHKYKIAVQVEDGQGLDLKGTLEAKDGKSDKDGKSQVDFKVSDFSMTGGGGDGTAPAPAKHLIDKQNMPETISVDGDGPIFIVLALSSYLPGKELVKGESFNIDWKGKDGGGTITGKGSITEIKTDNGIKIAVVKSTMQVTPSNQPDAAEIEVVSEFNLADGTLIKSTGKGNIPNGGKLTFNLALVK